MQDCLAKGVISGDGYYTKLCHALLKTITGCSTPLLTTSCTHALEMSGILLNMAPGDEVVLPSFTFVSTANAFATRGAVPRFVDVRDDTLNIDEQRIPSFITSKTKAIVVVHYAGVACEMNTIMDIARHHGLPVIEDNAHGLFGTYRGRPLGSIGTMATLSFHETKNITCGEGGALLINDPALDQRAEIIREKGTNRSRFFRGEVDKYSWVDTGSSYLPSHLLAAFLFAQLEAASVIQNVRLNLWNSYQGELESWATKRGFRTPCIPDDCEQAYHMYYLRLPDLETRSRFIQHMKSRGIMSVFHYQPLHASIMGSYMGGKPGDCPVAEKAADDLVRLPFFNGMTIAEQQAVIEAALAFD